MPDITTLTSEAVSEAIAGEGGGIAVAIVTVVEAVLDDGQPYLITLSDGDLSTWRAMGMLQAALEDAKARHTGDVIAGYVNGEEDY